MDEARARYTYHPMLPVLGLLFAFPVVCPIIWWRVGLLGLPGWSVPLIILVAAPLTWGWALFRLVYRLELTDASLRLRAPLATTRVPLAELREISTSRNGNNMGRVVYGRNHRRTLLAGMGLMDFLERVRPAAPQARIAVSDLSQAQERVGRLFHRERADGR